MKAKHNEEKLKLIMKKVTTLPSLEFCKISGCFSLHFLFLLHTLVDFKTIIIIKIPNMDKTPLIIVMLTFNKSTISSSS